MKLASFFLTKTNGNWTKPMSEIEVHFPEIFLKFLLTSEVICKQRFLHGNDIMQNYKCKLDKIILKTLCEVV